MSKLANLKKKAADFEQRRMFDRALAAYEEVLQEQEGAEEADISLFNRVGDLHLRQGNVEDALRRYEQAVDLYVERGFHNNAVALCNKILRQDPGRAEIHFRLGQISCSKGFRTEARRHFQEYVAKLDRAGLLERAVTALRGFADEHDELDDVRLMLADVLLSHGRVEHAIEELSRLRERYELDRRHAEARTILDRILTLDPEFQVRQPASADESVQMDGGLAAALDGPGGRTQSSHHRPPAALDLVLFEPTEAATAIAHPASVPTRTAADTMAAEVDAAAALAADGAAGLDDDGPRTAAERLAEGLDSGPAPTVAMPDGLIRGADFGDDREDATPLTALDLEPTALDSGVVEFAAPPLPGLEGNAGVGAPDLLDDVTARPPAEPVVLAAAWDADGEAWEIPELSDDQLPGAALDAAAPDASPADAEGGGALDLILTDEPSARATGAGGSTDDHESGHAFVILDDGQSPGDDGAFDGAFQVDVLGGDEADDEPGQELVYLTDDATYGTVYEFDGEAADPAGDTPGDDAFTVLEAAPTDEPGALPSEPSVAHRAPSGADGERAGSLPAGASAAEPPRAPSPVPQPAAEQGPPAAGGADSFVNLGDWLRADDEPRSTRMVTEERAPTGDEDADFAEMLRKFKQGVADNVDDTDYASHYDLGIAFREMGLVDEAIAAFQRALRGTGQRVRAFEALGQCFIDKEQYAVAASVLQRALQEPGSDDERLVGVLYLLGRTAEAQNQRTEALRYYQRVFAVDIEFGDVADRIGAVERIPL